jgi:hypothetical protein
MRFLPIALLLSAAVAASAMAQGGSTAFTVVETGRSFATLSGAVGSIGNGRGTIQIAPGTYRQCAVQQGGDIVYRSAQPRAAIFDGAICEGKAALVLRGHSARVEGVIFQNMRVPDGNGAGIRLERGDLDVTGSTFRNSEEGILTHDDPESAIRIDGSTFERLGRCDRDLDCAHGIYVGNYGSLSVTRSRFQAGNGGHYLKTRSARVSIVGNSFDDSAGRATNYMIDLSNGASGTIGNNVMVQGRDKENYSAFITVAPEGRTHDSSGLTVVDNSASFVPGLERQSTFVANWTADRVKIGANRLAAGVKVTDRR